MDEMSISTLSEATNKRENRASDGKDNVNPVFRTMPVAFQSQLYDHGYIIRPIPPIHTSYFSVVSHQLFSYGGIVLSAEETKSKVTEYIMQEKGVSMASDSSSDLIKGINMKISVEKHMYDLEQNLREADDCDFRSTALCFNMEMVVFYPNDNDELQMKTFNQSDCETHFEDGSVKMTDTIVIVLGTYHTPTRYYCATTIHKNLILNNPFRSLCACCASQFVLPRKEEHKHKEAH